MSLSSIPSGSDPALALSLSATGSRSRAELARPKDAAADRAPTIEDTVEITDIAARASRGAVDSLADEARGVGANAQDTLATAQESVVTRSLAQTASERVFSQGDVDSLLKSYGSSSGQGSYQQTLDFNNDGKIDFADLSFLLSRVNRSGASSAPTGGGQPNAATTEPAPTPIATQPVLTPNAPASGLTTGGSVTGTTTESAQTPISTQPVLTPSVQSSGLTTGGTVTGTTTESAQTPISTQPVVPGAASPKFTQADLSALLASFGKSAGQDGFDARFDFQGRGSVGFEDLSTLLANFASPVSTAAQRRLTGVLAGYGARQGDANYDPTLDAGGKGYIGFADLSAALAGIAGEA